jgi:hypothetical protein
MTIAVVSGRIPLEQISSRPDSELTPPSAALAGSRFTSFSPHDCAIYTRLRSVERLTNPASPTTEQKRVMDYARLAKLLPLFIDQELELRDGGCRPRTVTDLRLGIRNLRLTEFRNWSGHDLDLMEVHAAQFDDGEALERVLEIPTENSSAPVATALSTVGSPSPFAWT